MSAEEKYNKKVEKLNEALKKGLIFKREFELLVLRAQNFFDTGKDEEKDETILDIQPDELSPVGIRIKKLINELTDGSVIDFTDAINIKLNTFTRVLRIDSRTNKYPPVTLEILEAICARYPEVNTEWLLLGIGSIFKPVEAKQYIEKGYQPVDGASLKIDGLLDIYIEKGAIKKGKI